LLAAIKILSLKETIAFISAAEFNSFLSHRKGAFTKSTFEKVVSPYENSIKPFESAFGKSAASLKSAYLEI
jgi:hypothetical protein